MVTKKAQKPRASVATKVSSTRSMPTLSKAHTILTRPDSHLPKRVRTTATDFQKTVLSGDPVKHLTVHISSVFPKQKRDPKRESEFRMNRDVILLFKAICEAWSLPVNLRAVLLGKEPTSGSTYHHWVKKAESEEELSLDKDVLDRIAFVTGIYESATSVWGSPEAAAWWLLAPSSAPEFGGKAPIDRMMRGGMEDLRSTWSYIHAVAEGLDQPMGFAAHELEARL